MANWVDLDVLRRQHPAWTSQRLASALGANRGWVVATFKRRFWTLHDQLPLLTDEDIAERRVARGRWGKPNTRVCHAKPTAPQPIAALHPLSAVPADRRYSAGPPSAQRKLLPPTEPSTPIELISPTEREILAGWLHYSR